MLDRKKVNAIIMIVRVQTESATSIFFLMSIKSVNSNI
jgi:hypothetical protein